MNSLRIEYLKLILFSIRKKQTTEVDMVYV